MLRIVRTRRRLASPYIGALAFRLVQAAQRIRRLRMPAQLFRRVAYSRGTGWVPRSWFERRGRLFHWLRTQTLRIHRGRRWRRLYVQRWNVGFSVGNFARTRAVAVFKKKASTKKKQRRQQAQATAQTFDWRIQRIRDIRAGTRRRTSLLHDSAVELQLKGIGSSA